MVGLKSKPDETTSGTQSALAFGPVGACLATLVGTMGLRADSRCGHPRCRPHSSSAPSGRADHRSINRRRATTTGINRAMARVSIRSAAGKAAVRVPRRRGGRIGHRRDGCRDLHGGLVLCCRSHNWQLCERRCVPIAAGHEPLAAQITLSDLADISSGKETTFRSSAGCDFEDDAAIAGRESRSAIPWLSSYRASSSWTCLRWSSCPDAKVFPCVRRKDSLARTPRVKKSPFTPGGWRSGPRHWRAFRDGQGTLAAAAGQA